MKANFKNDLIRGKAGEMKFLEKFPDLKLLDGFKGDFELPDGRKLELKSDSYSPFKWPNLIMERYGSGEKDGGPWQSREHGCEILAYWFINYDVLLLYKLSELIPLVEALVEINKIPLEEKHNIRHITRFYRVRRDLLAHLLLGEDILHAK